MDTEVEMTWCGKSVFSFVALLVAAFAAALPGVAADKHTDLARQLIAHFYDDLAPDNKALGGFLDGSFQIIGSDGLRFDRDQYLKFPKKITKFEISDIVARRDRDMLTATYQISYVGAFNEGHRTVPKLPRLAVFREDGGNWKLVALAALGTGSNEVTTEAAEALTRFFAAVASGDHDRIRAVVSPDYQIQRADGKGYTLQEYLSKSLPTVKSSPVMQDLVVTSFSNTMVTRYMLKVEETIQGKTAEYLAPRLTVFQRIDGKWRVSAHANFAKLK